MSKPQAPRLHGLRAVARRTFAVALAVISAIAAFAIAGDAAHDDANWILPAKAYACNRYTNLAQINPGTPLKDEAVSFPTTDSKLLTKVIVGGTTCPR